MLAGAFTQIAATALMLSVMGERSFVVAYAYIKTEPVQVALFGLIFLGDTLTPLSAAAILIATAGVIVISLKPGAGQVSTTRSTADRLCCPARCSRCRRSAIAAPSCRCICRDFVMAATFTVTVGLVIQAALLSLYLALRDPQVLRAIARAWKPSLFAGFMGAFASEFWFLGLRHRHGRQRAHAGAGRGAVRARRDALRLQAADHHARGRRHRAGGDRRRAAGVGVLSASAGAR